MPTYTNTGPFVNASAPGITYTFLNNVEASLDKAVQNDGTVNLPTTCIAAGTLPAGVIVPAANVSGTVTAANTLAGGPITVNTGFITSATGGQALTVVSQNDIILQPGGGNWVYVWGNSAHTHFDTYGNFSGNANTASSILNGTLNQSLVIMGGNTLWVNQQLVYGSTPMITMPIGDSDTGLQWYSDGHWALMVNNVSMLDITSSQLTASSQITAPGANITSYVRCNKYQDQGNGYIGFSRASDGFKLAEMKNNGNFVIGGNTYYTIGASYYYTAGGSFDAFDIAEVFEADQAYDYGTILCPGDTGKLTQCTHVGCHCALPISQQGAFCAGSPDPEHGRVPIAMQGRILVKTTDATITARSHVTSDGMGGVMAASHGHHALGFALDAPHDGTVAIFLRQHTI